MESVQYLHNFFQVPCWASIGICSLYNTETQTISNLDKNKDNYLPSKAKTLWKQTYKQSSKGWQNYRPVRPSLKFYAINNSQKIHMYTRKKPKYFFEYYWKQF